MNCRNTRVALWRVQWLLLFVLSGPVYGACSLSVGASGSGSNGEQGSYLIVLSMDGFRWDYAESVPTPNFDRLAREGVVAESLQSSFPSNTFPNHYTIATGLYPGNHGIVDNTFYDRQRRARYSIGDRETVRDGTWYGGEPIWNTAARQGVCAASLFWVGADAQINGRYPDYWLPYNGRLHWDERIDMLIDWLSLPLAERPRLLMLYLNQPDSTAHRHSPDSAEVRRQIRDLDGFLGDLLQRLESLPIAERINLIVTTDHGMATATTPINLDAIIDSDSLRGMTYGSALAAIDPRRGQVDEVLRALSADSRLQVYRRSRTPAHWHYGTGPRIGEILVAVEPPYRLSRSRRPSSAPRGAHGYDPRLKDMHGIFYAWGPAFKPGYRQPTFENVHIYPLMAHLLNVEPAESDGRLAVVAGMLHE